MILRPPGRRILMTADTVGGVWTYAMDLARALGAEGVEVALATMGSPVSPGQLGSTMFELSLVGGIVQRRR